MIISVNWLKQYVDIDLPIDELATLIGARLVEIEEVIDLGRKYEDIVIAKIVSVEKHPDADRLNICKIDDGGKTKDVERDENGHVQVVCGAPNVREGLFVAWLPPDSTVPSSIAEGDPFTLEARKLRGVMSNGMLASEKELDISDSHEGIMEVPESVPGNLFADAYLFNDYLLDIENKSLTHRPDTFGIIGFAREVAAIQGKAFQTPDWLKNVGASRLKADNATEDIKVTIDDPKLSERYQAIVLADIAEQKEVHPLMPTLLARSGMRPISPVVDVTNYLMLTTGQPLHAFDYDKLLAINNGQIDMHVRSGRKGEKLHLIDGRTIELSTEDIVIANGEIAVALAGAMGGRDTEVDESTNRVLIESATFNLYNLRATQMRHGIFSEAITRFTKGQSAALTEPVLAQAVHLLNGLTGAIVVSKIAETYPGKKQPKSLVLSVNEVNAILGSHYTAEQISETLQNVEFEVQLDSNDQLTVVAPYWRTDIHIKEDLVEEVGRINGFDEISPVLPTRSFVAKRPSGLEELKQQVRSVLARAGANDILSYSFVHGDLLEKVGQKAEDSYRIVNAISPRLQYYRQTLTPSLLELVHPNIKVGFSEFSLFEINKTHDKTQGKNHEDLPIENETLALVYANKKNQQGAAFYKVKRQLDFVGLRLGLEFDYVAIKDSPDYSLVAPFALERSAYVHERKTGILIGLIGEYDPRVIKNVKLPEYTAGFEIDIDRLLESLSSSTTEYTPLSKYQGTSQDITVEVATDIAFSDVQKAIVNGLQESIFVCKVTPLGIYQKEGSMMRRLSFRLAFVDHRQTIDTKKVTIEVANIAKILENDFAAKII